MIKIQWRVEGQPQLMEEIFEDRESDRAQERYEELVNFPVYSRIRMLLVDESDAVLMAEARCSPETTE